MKPAVPENPSVILRAFPEILFPGFWVSMPGPGCDANCRYIILGCPVTHRLPCNEH